jgi:SAM-dependent MidA family methyltransferase
MSLRPSFPLELWAERGNDRTVYATPLQTQRSFLLSLGLAIRLQSLLDHAPSADRKRVIAESARRLVDKTHRMGMGRMYKFMSVVPRSEKEEGQSVFPFDIGEVD